MTHKYVKWHDPEYVEKKQKKTNKQTNIIDRYHWFLETEDIAVILYFYTYSHTKGTYRNNRYFHFIVQFAE